MGYKSTDRWEYNGNIDPRYDNQMPKGKPPDKTLFGSRLVEPKNIIKENIEKEKMEQDLNSWISMFSPPGTVSRTLTGQQLGRHTAYPVAIWGKPSKTWTNLCLDVFEAASFVATDTERETIDCEVRIAQGATAIKSIPNVVQGFVLGRGLSPYTDVSCKTSQEWTFLVDIGTLAMGIIDEWETKWYPNIETRLFVRKNKPGSINIPHWIK